MKNFILILLSLFIIRTTSQASEFFFQPEAGRLALTTGLVNTNISYSDQDTSTPGNPEDTMSYIDLLIDLKLAYSVNDYVTLGIETGLGSGVLDNEDDLFSDEISYSGLDMISLNSRISLPAGIGKVLIKPELLIGLKDFDCDADDDCSRTFSNTIVSLGFGYEIENNSNTYGAFIDYSPYTSDFKFDDSTKLESESGLEGSLFYERQFTKKFRLGFKYTYLESSIIPNITKLATLKNGKVTFSSLSSYMRLNLNERSSLIGGLEIGAITDEEFQDTKLSETAMVNFNFAYRHTF